MIRVRRTSLTEADYVSSARLGRRNVAGKFDSRTRDRVDGGRRFSFAGGSVGSPRWFAVGSACSEMLQLNAWRTRDHEIRGGFHRRVCSAKIDGPGQVTLLTAMKHNNMGAV